MVTGIYVHVNLKLLVSLKFVRFLLDTYVNPAKQDIVLYSICKLVGISRKRFVHIPLIVLDVSSVFGHRSPKKGQKSLVG